MIWIQSILKKWLQGIIELILLLPLFLILYAYVPLSLSLPLWIGSFALFYLAGVAFGRWLGARSRWSYLLLSLLLAGVFVITITEISYYEIFTWLIAVIVMYRGHLFWSKRWTDLFPLYMYWINLGLYFVCSLVFSRVEELKSLFPILTAAGLISLIITLWMTNSMSLQSIHYSGKKTNSVSKSIKRHNKMAVGIVTLIILFIAFFNTIKDMFVNAILAVTRFIVGGILYLISLMDSPQEEKSQMPEQGNMPPMEMPPEGEPALWAEILEMVMYVVVGIAVLVLLFFGLRKLIKWFVETCLKLIAFLKTKGLMTVETTGYTDEKTKTVTLKGLGTMYKDRLQNWLSERLRKEPKWKDLQNNRERVRYIYRHWLINRISLGYTHKNSLTPNETSEELLYWRGKDEGNTELAAVYNEARYGNKDIPDDRVSGIKTRLNKD